MRKSDALKAEKLKEFKKKELLDMVFGHLTVIENVSINGRNYWKCKCICGVEKNFTTSSLTYGKFTSCGCVKYFQKDNLENKRFGKLLVLNKCIEESQNKYIIIWNCVCDCGNFVKRGEYALKNEDTTSCGCNYKNVYGSERYNWKGVGEISMYNFIQIRNGAIGRNIKFDLKIEEIWELFLKQNGKCALSGMDIYFGKTRKVKNTASLDRIDSEKPYEIGNIQWVHKDINFMKQSYNVNYFIQLCKNVVSYNQMEK